MGKTPVTHQPPASRVPAVVPESNVVWCATMPKDC